MWPTVSLVGEPHWQAVVAEFIRWQVRICGHVQEWSSSDVDYMDDGAVWTEVLPCLKAEQKGRRCGGHYVWWTPNWKWNGRAVEALWVHAEEFGGFAGEWGESEGALLLCRKDPYVSYKEEVMPLVFH